MGRTGRSITEDLKTELENQSWTNLGVNPNIVIGKRYGRITGNYGVIVHDEGEDESYVTFAHSIIASDQDALIEIWHKNNDDRQNMLDDIEAILLGNSSTWVWSIESVERQTLKNNLYQANISVRRLLS